MKNIDAREKLIDLLTNSPQLDVLDYTTGWEEAANYLIEHGVTLNERDCHWATEQAYKNGYKKGYEDGLRERKRKNETKCTDSGISQRTVEALERMGQKVHGGEDGK